MKNKEAILIIKAATRRLINVRINDCHRRIQHAVRQSYIYFQRLKPRVPKTLLDIILDIADRRAEQTKQHFFNKQREKLTKLQQTDNKRRHLPDDNLVRNLSSRHLDQTEKRVLSYGLKHSIAPKRVPTETIVAGVESALSRSHEMSESDKDTIRSRISSTILSTPTPNSNLAKEEQHALKRLKNDNNIVILPADKGRVTVIMDKTDYHDKMTKLTNNKQTYELLKRDPTPALQRRLNNKLLSLKKNETIDNYLYNRLRCSVPQAPKLYGLPKIHKPDVPMRPIVSFCGSPTYELSKLLATILRPLTLHSPHRLQSTEDFVNAIKTINIPNDYKLVSFDVTSLFTSIPLQLALDCTETALKRSTTPPKIPIQDIMDLLSLCLTSTFFQYNNNHYKQLHGTAMGSPVSVVVAEIVMQNIEQQALNTYTDKLPFWFRFVDDTITAMHEDKIDNFHEHLNKQNTDIQFTKETEENGQLPFLDCLVKHDNNRLRTTVYRKPTHTDRLLDESSYHPTSHKATTVQTLTKRALLVCDSDESLQSEIQHLNNVFFKNNYSTDFINNNTYKPTQNSNTTNALDKPSTIATIPYVRGVSETIARVLHPYGIRVAHKPITTLRHLLTHVKDTTPPLHRQGTIYKIQCHDCSASYIGETGRNLKTRLKEHKRATEIGDTNNHIAEHYRKTKHSINWDSATCINFSTNWQQRLTLESWYTNLEQKPLNRSQHLPAPYKRLLDAKRPANNTLDRQTTR